MESKHLLCVCPLSQLETTLVLASGLATFDSHMSPPFLFCVALTSACCAWLLPSPLLWMRPWTHAQRHQRCPLNNQNHGLWWHGNACSSVTIFLALTPQHQMCILICCCVLPNLQFCPNPFAHFLVGSLQQSVPCFSHFEVLCSCFGRRKEKEQPNNN